jgi:membrane fusion protein (multidrug efflux system)
VSSGITPGENLIVEGLLMLQPGMAVTATAFEPENSREVPPDMSSSKESDGGAL